ncbi:preprotein translocase subunit SecB [Staphylococcus aureus]|nr:preprotein translocase subunit SecB [Staphylococcus aureus]CAC5947285.1 preprotein translocase subunit SecB [Staphylococcus aureus]
MAGITFLNYVVDTMNYKTNASFDREKVDKIKINEEIDAKIDIINDDNNAIITLRSALEENENVPFSFEVIIVGYFEYNKEESDDILFKDFLRTNAIAILFPYLRSIVSDLTGKSNIYPNYNMSVRNIAKELEDSGNIEIYE